MLKPTRTILTLVTGSLVLGLAGTGAAVADRGPMSHQPSHQVTVRDDGDEMDGNGSDEYGKDRHARGVVVSKGALTVRSKPNTHSRSLGKVHPHDKLDIKCKERGENVRGNNLWYLLEHENGDNGNGNGRGDDDMEENNVMPDDENVSNGDSGYDHDHGRTDRWVAARYVKNLTPVKWCRS
ncbi:hypothetical protein LG634_09490 [Streptomyces bambusae]|uniref:hypothetical protein n=1 Tax=Streptomyces bambusae TaxID=1550616 RepID=UPI001CFC4984|nr:hypothetical protein [Streptomyces bambusae]MCB5165060.1 hypothetical protein [Streptomyces bambusae]